MPLPSLRTPLLDLPDHVVNDSGERSCLRLIEPAHCDVDAVFAQIEGGSYGKPFIIEDARTRRLYFSLDLVQSAMRLDDPFALEFAYTRKMMAFLLFVPEPGDVLMVGLGGGSLAKFCHRYLPRTRLTVVELNPDVIALRGEFGVPEDARLAIVEADAAEYLAASEGDADVLLLDGFDADGIAPAFLRRGFYRAARRRLRPGGVAVANFAGPRNFWSKHLALLSDAFDGQVHAATVPGGDNHLAFAFADADAGTALDWARLEERARQLAGRFPLDFAAILGSLREGAELNWAKPATHFPTIPANQGVHPCRRSTRT
jgi:spermidine synthase